MGTQLEATGASNSAKAKCSTHSDTTAIVGAVIAGVLVLALLVAFVVRSRKLETVELVHPLTAYAEADDQ